MSGLSVLTASASDIASAREKTREQEVASAKEPSKSNSRETIKNLDQQVQDEIDLSRSADLIAKIKSSSATGKDFASALEDASSEIRQMGKDFAAKFKVGSDKGQTSNEAFQEAVRRTVVDILSGEHPAKAAKGYQDTASLSFDAKVLDHYQRLRKGVESNDGAANSDPKETKSDTITEK